MKHVIAASQKTRDGWLWRGFYCPYGGFSNNGGRAWTGTKQEAEKFKAELEGRFLGLRLRVETVNYAI